MASRVFVLAALAVAAGWGCSSSNVPTAPVVMTPEPSPGPMPIPQAPVAAVPQTAHYVVVFDATWSASSQPVDFPDTAHFSGLVGGTHGPAVRFWTAGALATEGIRRMAERGSKSPLDQEVNDAIAAGTAEFLLSGPNLASSPLSTSMELDISQTFPLVTLVSMIAPSPDWFVGVDSLPLFHDGQWVDELRVDLHGYDAGTDSGTTYTSADRATAPRQPVTRVGYPLAPSGPAPPLGSFTFRRTR